MAKRPRPEEAVIEPPSESANRENEGGTKEVPEAVREGPKERLGSTSEAVGSGQVSSSVQGATAEVAQDEALDDGSFWSLLLRAGYTSW